MIQWNEDNGIKVFRISNAIYFHIKQTPEYLATILNLQRSLSQEAGDLAKIQSEDNNTSDNGGIWKSI